MNSYHQHCVSLSLYASQVGQVAACACRACTVTSMFVHGHALSFAIYKATAASSVFCGGQLCKNSTAHVRAHAQVNMVALDNMLCLFAARPSGPVYVAAHAMWRNLQRQVLERGWRCSSPKSPAGAAAAAAYASASCDAGGGAADTAQHDGPNRSSSSSPLSGRRFLTIQEQTRQRLEAAGAKKYEEWAAEKQRAELLERQRAAVSDTCRLAGRADCVLIC
jgi:hypothetical protein